jgi:hypothetical protein
MGGRGYGVWAGCMPFSEPTLSLPGLIGGDDAFTHLPPTPTFTLLIGKRHGGQRGRQSKTLVTGSSTARPGGGLPRVSFRVSWAGVQPGRMRGISALGPFSPQLLINPSHLMVYLGVKLSGVEPFLLFPSTPGAKGPPCRRTTKIDASCSSSRACLRPRDWSGRQCNQEGRNA